MLGDIVKKPISGVQKTDIKPEVRQHVVLAKEPIREIRQAGSGRVPLVLTVIGVLVFVSGVSGLFMYALSGS